MPCILITGCQRSGTSLVAGVLYHAGLYMGEGFREPDEWNLSGYWEDKDLHDLNRKLLEMAGGTSWYRLPTAGALVEAATELSAEIRDIIASKNTRPLWGFKDPCLSMTIGALYPYLPEDTRFVIVRRELETIVDSLMRRAQGRGYYETPGHWWALTREYDLHLAEFLAENRTCLLELSYCNLVDRAQCQSIARRLSWFCELPTDRVEQAMERTVRWKNIEGQ